MTTTLSGANGVDYKPVEVEVLDIVGYRGGGKNEGFVILNPHRIPGRELPPLPRNLEAMPWCIKCIIRNNQQVNFGGEFATLHDINGKWHFKTHPDGQLKPLWEYSFFEIGHQL